jgi:hypothetical protein
MGETIRFKAIIHEGDGGGAYVLFPYSTDEMFGIKNGRVPMQATFDGEPYSGSMVKYGNPQHMIPILKSIREKIGKGSGDTVEVTIKHDTSKREVEVPADLKKALKANKLKKGFAEYSYSHQREYVMWIEAAKKVETRQRRIEKAMEMIKEKKNIS